MVRKIYLSILCLTFAALPAWSQKSPDQFFNKTIGSDKTLIIYNDIITYFNYLGENSARIKVNLEGASTLNNQLMLAFISSEQNIKDLNKLVKINKQLANPDRLNPDYLLEFFKEGKVFVLITGTIHATEVASSQMMMLLAHKLATSQDPEIKSVLDNVVLMLMPSINPDGNIMVTNWYNKYLGTDYEGGRMPFLYHHYAGHDTNRDFYMLNLMETRVVNKILHHRYFPQVFLDMHQMGSTGPRMFVPPFKDPLNQNLDPILVKETDLIGTFMALRLQENNKQGVASGYAFDAYWPGGSKNTAWYKNVVGILTELSSVAMATPMYIDYNELRVSSKGLPEYKPQVNFPDPWIGGWWRLKDIIEYEMIAAEALLEITAKNRRRFLNNFYQTGLRSISKGESQAPYAYIISGDQWDRPAAYTFLDKLKEGGVRIYQLQKEIRIHHQVYAKGSFIIPLNQPYGSFVKVMMEKQHYPEIRHMRNGPIMEPYDACGWTMPIQMGVKYRAVNIPVKQLDLQEVFDLNYPDEIVQGSGPFFTFSGRYNRSAIVANRLFKINVPVYRFSSSGKLNPGDFVVKSDDVSESEIKRLIKGTGISVTRITELDGSQIIRNTSPSIAIYQPFLANIDEGWTRWVLDNFEFNYTIIHNSDFKNKNLLNRFDVLIVTDMNRQMIVNGTYSGYWARYAKKVPPRYTGGIGQKGVDELKIFVKNGGSLLLLDSSYELAEKDFSLPVTNIIKGISRDKYSCPGSLVTIQVNTNDPIGWGLEQQAVLFMSQSPVFKTQPPFVAGINRSIVARFKDREPHLISGFLKGEKILNRSVAIARFNYFKGNIILFGGRIQHRAQTYATFKFLFNGLFFSGLDKTK